MTPEQSDSLHEELRKLRSMDLDQLYAALHSARTAKAASPDEHAPYWRSLMIGIGEQLHRRLGPGALQEFFRRYG